MNINYRAVSKASSLIMMILGISMIPSIVVALIYREIDMLQVFIVITIVAILIGAIPFFTIKRTEETLKKRDALFTVAFCWTLVIIVGAIPYIMSGYTNNLIDAIFESASGFSTTGSSIFSRPEALPHTLLFWRSYTHWLGGMGIIIIVTSILPTIGGGSHILAEAESSGSLQEKVTPKSKDMVTYLYTLYLSFSGLLFILLLIGGMNVFDALIHTFGTVSTGGFSNYSEGLAHFDSSFIHYVIMIFMLLAAINFVLYFSLISRRWKDFFKDKELRWFLTITVTAIVLVAINLLATKTYSDIALGIKGSAFEVISTITTTGYSLSDYNFWPTFAKMIIFLLLIIGGCTGSAASGIKVFRVMVLMKLIKRNLERRLHPSSIVAIKAEERPIPVDIVSGIAGYALTYIGLIFLGTLFISLEGYDLITSLSAVMSSVANLGPGFELVGPMENYAFFSGGSKLMLSLLMLMGRLELFTILLLFTPRFWNPDR